MKRRHTDSATRPETGNVNAPNRPTTSPWPAPSVGDPPRSGRLGRLWAAANRPLPTPGTRRREPQNGDAAAVATTAGAGAPAAPGRAVAAVDAAAGRPAWRFRYSRWALLVAGIAFVVHYDPPARGAADALAYVARTSPLLVALLAADGIAHITAGRGRRREAAGADGAGTGGVSWQWQQRFRTAGRTTLVGVLVAAAGQSVTGHPGGWVRWWGEGIEQGSNLVVFMSVGVGIVVAALLAARAVAAPYATVRAPQPTDSRLVGNRVEIDGFVGESDTRRAVAGAIGATQRLGPRDSGSGLGGAIAIVGPPGSGRTTIVLAALDAGAVPAVVVHIPPGGGLRGELVAWRARTLARATAVRAGTCGLVVEAGPGTVDIARRLTEWATGTTPGGTRLRGPVFVVDTEAADWMHWPVVDETTLTGREGPGTERAVLAAAGVDERDMGAVLSHARRRGGRATAAELLAAAKRLPALEAAAAEEVLERRTHGGGGHLRATSVGRAGTLLVAAACRLDAVTDSDSGVLDSRRRADDTATSLYAAAAAEERLCGDVTGPSAQARRQAAETVDGRCRAYGGDPVTVAATLEAQAQTLVASIGLETLAAVAHAEAVFGPLSVDDAQAIAGGARTGRGDGRWYLDAAFMAEVTAWCRHGGPVPLPGTDTLAEGRW